MTLELYYLVLVSTLTAILWVPYLLDRIAVRGLIDSVGYPKDPKPHSAWAIRLQLAHSNAIENLVVFATLVLAAHASDIANNVTALACSAYFWARLVHVTAYTFGISWLRTIGFFGGFVAQLTLASQLLF